MADINQGQKNSMIGNGFTKKSVGTLTLGEKLKKARSDRRLSINEVSRQARIQVKYLEYLESGAYEKLPADVYVRGFLKNYAEVLGMEDEILMRLYQKEIGIKKNIEKRNIAGQTTIGGRIFRPISISSFVITPRMLTIFIAALFFLGGGVYLYRELGAFASMPRLVILQPLSPSSVESDSVIVEGLTDRDARVFINNQPVVVNDDGRFKQLVTVQPGANVINIASQNRFQKEATSQVFIQSTLPVNESVEPIPSVPNEENSAVTSVAPNNQTEKNVLQ